jgi:hypothetical protein
MALILFFNGPFMDLSPLPAVVVVAAATVVAVAGSTVHGILQVGK